MGQSLHTSTLTAIYKRKKFRLCVNKKKNRNRAKSAMYALRLHVKSAINLKRQDINDVSIKNIVNVTTSYQDLILHVQFVPVNRFCLTADYT